MITEAFFAAEAAEKNLYIALSSFSRWEKARMRGDIEISFPIIILSLIASDVLSSREISASMRKTLTLSQRERETILILNQE